MKPILFNTEMVEAILEGRKTMTRRIIKPQPSEKAEMRYVFAGGRKRDLGKWHDWQQGVTDCPRWTPPYHADDILYVRETWRIQSAHRFEADARIEFNAGGPMTTMQFRGRCSDSHERPDYDSFIGKWWKDEGKWNPSIFMPKEAARIFLRVTRVSVERLQSITADECPMEGVWPLAACTVGERDIYYRSKFAELWDRTIKPADLDVYDWAANPWVWVIKFEKISKEEALKC